MSADGKIHALESDCQAAAALLEALKHERFEEVRQTLALPLRLAVSEQVIKDLWGQATWLTGPIEVVHDFHNHSRGYLSVVNALVNFQKSTFAVTVTCGPRHSILGIKLQAPIALGLPEPWEAPVYIDQEKFGETAVRVKPFWLFPGAEASLSIPRATGRKPAILFLQGSGVSDLDISIGAQQPAKDIAWGLASAGIVVLRIGKPLAWLAYKTKITSDVTAADEYLYTGNAALNLLATHPEVDPDQIFVAGLSMGGRLAPRLCLQSPVAIAGMISIAGLAQSMCEAFVEQAGYLQKHFPRDEEAYRDEINKFEELSKGLRDGSLTNKSPNPIAALPIPVPLSYFIDDEKHPPTNLVQRFNGRILIMQGMRDWQVPAEANVQHWRNALEKQIETGQATFKLYSDLPHTMVPFEEEAVGMKQYDEPGHVAAEVISDIAAWVRQSP